MTAPVNDELLVGQDYDIHHVDRFQLETPVFWPLQGCFSYNQSF